MIASWSHVPGRKKKKDNDKKVRGGPISGNPTFLTKAPVASADASLVRAMSELLGPREAGKYVVSEQQIVIY